MSDFRTLSASEMREFLSARGRRARCGLLNLKNEVTRKALRAPCVVEE